MGLKIPKNYYRGICFRSCYAVKFKSVGTGVVHCNYLRNISVVFFDVLKKFYQVENDDRIAQIVFAKCL